MARGNEHFRELDREYIFPVVERKLKDLTASHPDADIINLGVGDIALPLAPSVAGAICKATEEMTSSIIGYGPVEGYAFLRKAICEDEYSALGITAEEIFISDGANSDTTNIADLFSATSSVAITDPTYPAYLDTNILAGKKSQIVFLPCLEENHFIPKPPSGPCDYLYLCSPSNPTGVAMTTHDLSAFVAYAREHKSLILYDNAYAAFITSKNVPQSIYEVPGAKEVAIEFRSFSKSAGFTGLRCAYAVIPKTVFIGLGKQTISAHSLWMKRQNIKFNGVSYPIQRGAEATFFPKGKEETTAQVQSYLAQASLLKEGLTQMGFSCFGGTDSPYIWCKTPDGLSSWQFFDRLLHTCHLITIPGNGFGRCGEGYIRLSAFTTKEKATSAIERIQKL